MSKCEYDSGSMYGNRPLCARQADYEISYQAGYTEPFAVKVCEHHRDPMLGRIYPYRLHSQANGGDRLTPSRLRGTRDFPGLGYRVRS